MVKKFICDCCLQRYQDGDFSHFVGAKHIRFIKMHSIEVLEELGELDTTDKMVKFMKAWSEHDQDSIQNTPLYHMVIAKTYFEHDIDYYMNENIDF